MEKLVTLKFTKLPFSHNTRNTFLVRFSSSDFLGTEIIDIGSRKGTNREEWERMFKAFKAIGFFDNTYDYEIIHCNLVSKPIENSEANRTIKA